MHTIHIVVLDFIEPDRSSLLQSLDESTWLPGSENAYAGRFAMVKIDDTLHTQLHLLPIDGPYSTWKVLAEPAMGGIVLLACDQADTFAEVAREIKKINDYRPVQWVIATHTSADCSDDALHAAIGLPETCPVIGVDPADKDSARAVLRQLLVLLADDE